MELRVIQCQVGQFNFLGNEKSLSFSMGLFHNGELVKEGDLKARIYYSGEPSEIDEFDSPFENLESIFEKCASYASRVISSTDYLAEALLFAKIYSENYESIDAALLENHKRKVKDQIERLQQEMEWTHLIPNISYAANQSIDREIEKYSKWMASYKKDLDQLKEDSPKYQETKGRIEKYTSVIDRLAGSKVLPETSH